MITNNIQNQMKHVMTISKYLEKENEVEFFRNASIIFEKLFKKYYRGKNKNASYWEQRRWLFETLNKYYPEITKNLDPINKGLNLLSKYRNRMMHELEPNSDTEKLKEELRVYLKKLFKVMFALDKNFEEYDSKEIESKFKKLIETGGISIDEFEDIAKSISDDKSKICTYDITLYVMIQYLYSQLYGLIIGVAIGEKEAMEKISYEIISEELKDCKYLNEIEGEMYSADTRLFIRLKDKKRYQLKLKNISSDDYWQSILNIFKKKHMVRIHQENVAVTVEFLELESV